jgi:hypothetical protein
MKWKAGDDGTEPSLRGFDLADVHAAPRRKKPEWNAPSRSPSVLVFAAAVVVVILLTFAALELGEWIFARRGTATPDAVTYPGRRVSTPGPSIAINRQCACGPERADAMRVRTASESGLRA